MIVARRQLRRDHRRLRPGLAAAALAAPGPAPRATRGARSRCGTSRGSAAAEHGNDPSVAPFWDALYAAGADLILNGHDHDYERFAPQDPDGNRDRERGIIEIVVGTGGGELRGIGPRTKPNSLVRQGHLLGVIQVTLHADGWSTRFLSTDGSFADESSGACH